ncbi:hypothetical protein CB0940_00124 [Cercospora beticola]|uniref:Uncharacterized protein n=1 Tax=Cercospora beticola TaxID=122368 RepID=A0A2G5I910_CERBT|nr:hypothetical protein CB0940_00124 [Cercospora beticola]PIB01260.1 hypothetical protein CB0940_00124 [Cercospora beticola]WPA95527.1 hypothetical protein RHO25_000128 [Cercospora beticola]CAK1356250.1 unnamed protein product [Cercospora beticola]
MSQEDQSKPPSRKELEETIGALQNVAKAQNMAKELKEKAAKASSPAERERLFKEAYEKEVEANGHSKMARRMQSGTWQGLFGGGGIGAGVGMGLGTVLGLLVGGILSIPTTAIGGLVGASTGAIHGPWIKVGDVQKRFEDATPAEVADALEEEQRTGAAPPTEEQSTTQQHEQRLDEVDAPKERKKPRKIEIRSQGGT